MSKTWVVTAESSRARIFAIEKRISPLREIEDMANPLGRAQEQAIDSDRPGRAFDSAGEGRHAMERQVDARHHEAILFAKRIAERLDHARTQSQCDELILIAPPEFLGMLRQQLNAQTTKLVTRTIDKNLVQKDEADIRAYLFP
jgi:protein required for attachment to host cells